MRTDDPTERLVALSERQNDLLRILVQPIAQEAARQGLRSADERKVFRLTDGTRSSRQIEAETGVSKSTVARWWKNWRSAGLVVEPAAGTGRAVLTLDELELPPISSNPKASVPRKATGM